MKPKRSPIDNALPLEAIDFNFAFANVEFPPHEGQREPDFGVTSVNYDFAELLALAEDPR